MAVQASFVTRRRMELSLRTFDCSRECIYIRTLINHQSHAVLIALDRKIKVGVLSAYFQDHASGKMIQVCEKSSHVPLQLTSTGYYRRFIAR